MKPMMPHLRIAIVCGALLYFFVIFLLLKKNKLSVRYSIVWLASGFVMVVFAIFPYIVLVLGDISQISNPVNFMFTVEIVFILFTLLSHSSAVSVQEEKNKRLAQKAALLEERVRRLEAKLAATPAEAPGDPSSPAQAFGSAQAPAPAEAPGEEGPVHGL